jgi:hypothetical protein
MAGQGRRLAPLRSGLVEQLDEDAAEVLTYARWLLEEGKHPEGTRALGDLQIRWQAVPDGRPRDGCRARRLHGAGLGRQD